MKKILRVFLFFIIFNLAATIGIKTYITFSIVKPSLQQTGLTFSDLFKGHLDPVKAQKLKENIGTNSAALGKNTGMGIVDNLKKILPSNGFDYSNVPAAPYPYPEPSTIVDMNNKKAQEGFSQGMEILKESDKEYDTVRKNALNQ